MLLRQIFKFQISNKTISPVTLLTLNNNTQKRHASAFKFQPDIAPANLGETTKMNLCQSVTNALDISLSAEKSAGATFVY